MVLKKVCTEHMDKLPCRKNTNKDCVISTNKADITLVEAEIHMRSKFGNNYFK